ncbi:MAG: membrane protein insertase YidC, partial [Melioribacteraceae bacterium]|nr:membrane protein insertase YidC [Melioribacteraceae bacterium]
MDKQTIGAFILIGVILVVWLYINAPEQQPQTPQTNDSTLVEKSIDSVKDEFKKPAETLAGKKTERKIQTPDAFSTEQKEEKIITIETDLVKLELTSKGGKIKKYYLKNYGTWYYNDFEEVDFYNTHVQLINQFNGGDFDLLFVTQEGDLVNTSELNFESNVDNYYYRVEGEDSLTITYSFSPQEGKYLKKSFVFFG